MTTLVVQASLKENRGEKVDAKEQEISIYYS